MSESANSQYALDRDEHFEKAHVVVVVANRADKLGQEDLVDVLRTLWSISHGSGNRVWV